jgi:hypothetical protein
VAGRTRAIKKHPEVFTRIIPLRYAVESNFFITVRKVLVIANFLFFVARNLLSRESHLKTTNDHQYYDYYALSLSAHV